MKQSEDVKNKNIPLPPKKKTNAKINDNNRKLFSSFSYRLSIFFWGGGIFTVDVRLRTRKVTDPDTGRSRNDATDNIHDEYIRLTLIRVWYCGVGGAARMRK